MSEYEIFNGDEGIEIVPEPKKRKVASAKTKKELECNCNFFKEAFSLKHISLSLSVISIFFAFFVKFLSFIAMVSPGALIAAVVFFVLGFTSIFTALIFEIISAVREREFIFNGKTILILLAFFILFI